MDKFVKINSVQGGDFTPTQNLVDFIVPSSMGVVDLKDSYINLNTKINVVETSTDGGVGVYDMGLQWKQTGGSPVYMKFTNGALVKNCHVRSDQRGQIENIRRVDQLRQNLSTLTRSQREQFAESYLASNQLIDPVNRNQFTIFREINKTGSLPSRDLDICPIQISLADLFGFCDASPEVDLGKMGTLRFHFELNMDRLEAVQRMSTPADNWANVELKDMEDVTVVGDANTVQTKQKYTNLDLSPYYVGQPLEISGTENGGATPIPPNKRVVISSIVWDKDNGGHLLITFSESWATVAGGQSYTDIELTPIQIQSASVEVNMAEIVVKRVGNPVGIDEIQYDTFSTEETNANQLQSFQQQYQVEGDAKNVFIVFPDASTDLLSVNGDITDFRLRLNNQDLTDRSVDVDSPLYYDRVNMTLGNMGETTKNLIQNVGSTFQSTWSDVYTIAGIKSVFIANPLFITDREKYLQVNINAPSGNGVEKMTIFKQIPRTISL